MCNGLSLLSIRAGPLMITICCDPTTIVDRVVVLTTMYLMLRHHCTYKWSVSFHLTATQTQFWALETVNQLLLKETTNLTISQGYCCLKAIKHHTTRSVLFPNIIWLQRIFVQRREKSIFCMQYVCKVNCKYVVAHAYNMVEKIQSSSGWAFLGCAALSAACTGFWKCTCNWLLHR